ncbi:Uracil-DNA glycosylase, family 4 [Thioalkalivibrio nitratireducens DSM 14787]|uniref:Type-4 uracil-DNA glycosylase n=1 Tax=Thioalkalivibrio nitratireducens (strain DSM 14787 / UNIQEM 213 / ALEN2) TaxID=1255043 RepID=L0E2I1_THIND|nr:uracil-DNA glycosylase [Thioalkalivibrio nitratireducens]AGA34856.1 Uracil-DNA glycosylase, family 4 [Thioalkalivibrio nitratireducens DSM 14787]
MPLSRRQREVLQELGIPVWVPRERPVPPPAPGADTDPANERGNAMPRQAVAPPEPPAADTRREPAPRSPVSPVPVSPSAETVPPVAQLDWEALRARVAECAACAELAARRTQTVFGVGDPDADWLFIGEAPGAEEDRCGEPFVGRAGLLLDNMLAALGLRRGENVYIANILKCRPPGNRDPKTEEAAACRGYLDRQIELIRPRVIVAVGRVPAQALLDTDAPLGRLRGRDLQYRGVPLVVTYHPAYLLRSPTEKARAWQDLLRARACLAAG